MIAPAGYQGAFDRWSVSLSVDLYLAKQMTQAQIISVHLSLFYYLRWTMGPYVSWERFRYVFDVVSVLPMLDCIRAGRIFTSFILCSSSSSIG